MADDLHDKYWLGKVLSPRTRATPLGFDQGDPLVICRSSRDDDLRSAYAKIRPKAYYCGPGAMIGGRRHESLYLDISGTDWTQVQFVAFWKWIAENVMTTCPPGGFKGIHFV